MEPSQVVAGRRRSSQTAHFRCHNAVAVGFRVHHRPRGTPDLPRRAPPGAAPAAGSGLHHRPDHHARAHMVAQHRPFPRCGAALPNSPGAVVAPSPAPTWGKAGPSRDVLPGRHAPAGARSLGAPRPHGSPPPRRPPSRRPRRRTLHSRGLPFRPLIRAALICCAFCCASLRAAPAASIAGAARSGENRGWEND